MQRDINPVENMLMLDSSLFSDHFIDFTSFSEMVLKYLFTNMTMRILCLHGYANEATIDSQNKTSKTTYNSFLCSQNLVFHKVYKLGYIATL